MSPDSIVKIQLRAVIGMAIAGLAYYIHSEITPVRIAVENNQHTISANYDAVKRVLDAQERRIQQIDEDRSADILHTLQKISIDESWRSRIAEIERDLKSLRERLAIIETYSHKPGD